jgi:hypothetical protein
MAESKESDEQRESRDDKDGEDLLPEADAGKTDAAKYATDEGRTEEDLEP